MCERETWKMHKAPERIRNRLSIQQKAEREDKGPESPPRAATAGHTGVPGAAALSAHPYSPARPLLLLPVSNNCFPGWNQTDSEMEGPSTSASSFHSRVSRGPERVTSLKSHSKLMAWDQGSNEVFGSLHDEEIFVSPPVQVFQNRNSIKP